METLKNIQIEVLNKINDIIEKYKDESLRVSFEIAGPIKYIKDVSRYVGEAYNRFLLLGLDKSKDLKILDLCSGAGYFLYICNKQHTAVGLEWPQFFKKEIIISLYDDLAKAFGNEIYNDRIEVGKSFRIRRKFDLITAFYPTFDYVCESKYFWSVDDWELFIKYLMSRHLKTNGRIALKPLTRESGATKNEVCDLLLKQFKAKHKSNMFILRNCDVNT